MRYLVLIGIAMVFIAGCSSNTVSENNAPVSYSISYYLDHSTGGEKSILKYQDKEFLIYDTEQIEPFYELCQEVFPDIKPAHKNIWCYRTCKYESDGTPIGNEGYFIDYDNMAAYEPIAIQAYREMIAYGGVPAKLCKNEIEKVLKATDSAAQQNLADLVISWISAREKNNVRDFSLSSGDSSVWSDLLERRLDRPRGMAILYYQKARGFYNLDKLPSAPIPQPSSNQSGQVQ